MSFIFFLFFLLISIGAVILLVVLRFVRTIFGFGRKRNPSPGGAATNQRRSSRNPFKQEESKTKVFGEKEGEYVDYEEIED